MTTARDLSKQLADLLRREHEAMADFIAALATFDRERRWTELGHNGLFMYLHRELGLSKSAAFYRKTAADLAQRYPQILDALRTGELCLSTVAEVAKALKGGAEDISVVLPRFFHASRREAKEIVAELKPVASPPERDVVTSVTRTPARDAASLPLAASALLPPKSGSPANLGDANSTSTRRGSSPQGNQHADSIEPLTADLRRLHVTVDRECLALIETARDLLSHSDPNASSNDILKAGLRLLIADREKKKAAIVTRPRQAPPSTDPGDAIPASVKRAVWKRDGGRCQVPLASGGICGSTFRVQFGHLIPRGRGGLPTDENVRCECAPHNQRQADIDFGEAFMNRFRRGRARTAKSDAGSHPDDRGAAHP